MGDIAVNDFARRQTADSRFSHYSGSWEGLVDLCEAHWGDRVNSNPEGTIVVVPVPADGFFSGVVELKEGVEIYATFASRRKEEDPYVQVTARGSKAPAAVVELVVCSHDALSNDASTSSPWEIVSINARATAEPEPPHPVAMARNLLGLQGGTRREYSSEEFARAVLYWSTRAMVHQS